jgi:hypothetical protein
MLGVRQLMHRNITQTMSDAKMVGRRVEALDLYNPTLTGISLL